ncbi:alpha/beta hydrolase [Salinarimonas soli]|uniref:Alpha/beta hydrolase n=2 Tax=Salinarimonas soli TaxID=1638099 RepID=A0A5B2VBJ3_9HYPH|nr:alpha/beta hydrolase [Salinarimonas soli]
MLGGGDGPALEIVAAGPPGPSRGAPILFVHGAFGGAWIWAERMMPFLARRGRAVAAVSLRGHGRSEGHEALDTTSLADFGADLRRVVASLREPPILVGHSLGGLLAQLALGRLPLRGLVLLGSLPPEGLAVVGPRLALTEPLIWSESFMGSLARERAPISDALLRVLFSEGVPVRRAARYAARMTPESARALAEAHLPGPILPAAAIGVPALVLGGADDRLVWPVSTRRTAFYHGGQVRIVPRMGHFLMLDDDAEETAGAVLDWLEARGL